MVIILTDDQGYGDIGFNGNEWIETPTLDSLSKVSFKFENFYVSPVCAPTRASLLTGRYHYRTGTYWVSNGKENMNPEEYTLAELMRDNGYKTGAFGKWHNGVHYPFHPNQQGFDKFIGFCMGHWNNYFDSTVEEDGKPLKTEGYIADFMTDKAIGFIEENKENPFFCYIPYNTPHGPFQVPDKYFDKYKAMGFDNKAACVYGMFENIDDNVTKVSSKLDELILTENTIVIYMSDNGPIPGRYNAGLRGTKGHIHEGGVKVPSLMHIPKSLINENNKSIEPIAAHIDIMPTLIDLLGLKMKNSVDFDGLSLVKTLKGENDSLVRNRLFFNKAPQRDPEYMGGAVRTGDYRLVYRDNDTMLFNLKNDPFEEYNLKNEMPDLRDSLLDTYLNWIRKTMNEMPSFTSIPVGVEGQKIISMPAHEAIKSPNILWKEGHGWANDWLWNFQDKTDSVFWEIAPESPGFYDLILEFTATEKSEKIELKVQTNSKRINKPLSKFFVPTIITSPDRFPRKEQYEQTWGQFDLGEIEITKLDKFISLMLANSEINDLEVKTLILKRK